MHTNVQQLTHATIAAPSRRATTEQWAGRVGLFLHAEDFEAQYARMTSAGVQFVSQPRDEPYGRVAVFLDIAGNRWDLLGPSPQSRI